MKTQVDYQYKLLYAIGIILVVVFHVSGGGTLNILDSIFPVYSYHLALFMFSSGYFYTVSSEERMLSFLKKKVFKLLVPFFVWNIVYGSFVVPLLRSIGIQIGMPIGIKMGTTVSIYVLFIEQLIHGHSFIYNMGSWFIVPLFLVQVYMTGIRKFFRYLGFANEYAIFVIFLCQGIVGNQLSIAGYNTGWWLVLARCNYFLPFLAAGRLYSSELKDRDNLPSGVYFSILFAVALAIIILYDGPVSCTPAWCHDFVDPVIPFISGMLGILFWLRVSRIFADFGKNKYVLLIADHTFDIMMHHFLGFMLVKAAYAGLANIGICCKDFDFSAFCTDIWYFYFPKDQYQFRIIYAISGIVFPLIIWYVGNRLRKALTLFSSKRKVWGE